MFKIINSLRALLFAAFLLFVGNSFLLSSNSIILKELGYTDFYVGLVGSCIYLGALVGTFFSQSIIQKVGHIRSFGFFISVFGILTLLHIFTKEVFLWAIFRFGIGFTYYALVVIIESWINQKSKNEIRSRMLAVYEIVFYTGFAVGVLLLYVKPEYDYVFIISVLILMLCAIPLNLLKIKQPKLLDKAKVSIPNIFAVSKLAFICAFIGGFLMNGFFSMSQTYFLALGYNVKQISMLILLAMFGGFIAQLFVGKLSDIYGRKLAILTCSLIALISSLCLCIFKSSNNLIYLLIFLLGMGLFCLYALALARASDRAKESSQVLEIGRSLLFAYILGSVLSPLVLGLMLDIFGARAYMFVYVILLLSLFLFTLTQPKIDSINRIGYDEKPSQFYYLKNE
ncbi:MFS transporter [Campylobacter sp. MG1]|uniref:MFS transporter n=1 Tax=Campylobacter sp. MG1 TaxID=2976332 RepID=UPI00226CB18E|nr:MFS transporter [Campylobacter sp. MG1]